MDTKAEQVATNTIIQKAFTSFLEDDNALSNFWRHYLSERGVSDTSIDLFQLGVYTPKIKQVSEWEREILGLLTKEQDKSYYHKFQSRLMFPLVNEVGAVVGFAGRQHPDKLPPKYLNTPTTSLYHKSNFLYGLHQAKPFLLGASKSKLSSALLVEGYFACIISHQHKFQTAVACGGTSLTQSQVELLRAYTDEVVVCFDGDEAGRLATLRAIPLLMKEDFTIKIVLLPPHEDPDSMLVHPSKKEKFLELVSNPLTLTQFLAQASLKDSEKIESMVKWCRSCNSEYHLTPLLKAFERTKVFKDNWSTFYKLIKTKQ